jgi:NCAIR mutase (PurE)-related protein
LDIRVNSDELRQLALQLASQKIDIERFLQQVQSSPQKQSDSAKSSPLGNIEGIDSKIAANESATVDIDRQRRCGFPEVIYSEGKSAEVILGIVQIILQHDQNVLATRLDPEKAATVCDQFPQAIYHADARTLRIMHHQREALGRVRVISAGTSDLPVALEAQETLRWMQVDVQLITDVGVAGPQRLQARLSELEDCDALIVVAGMEGALPSVVGGYVACPVIGVPTSVGYGANFGGVSALLSMLNSCASNVTVVNIDAGFKAAYIAGLIAHRRHTVV